MKIYLLALIVCFQFAGSHAIAQYAPLSAKGAASSETGLLTRGETQYEFQVLSEWHELEIAMNWISVPKAGTTVVLTAPRGSSVDIASASSASNKEALARVDSGSRSSRSEDELKIRVEDPVSSALVASTSSESDSSKWTGIVPSTQILRLVAVPKESSSPGAIKMRMLRQAKELGPLEAKQEPSKLQNLENPTGQSLRLESSDWTSLSATGVTVTSERPGEFLVFPPKAMISVGVSSKSGEARLSLYRGESETALTGTAPSDGAIRWIGELSGPEMVRVVVHTKGVETPVRVEVSIESRAEAPAPVK